MLETEISNVCMYVCVCVCVCQTTGVVALAKHYLAYGAAIGGLNGAPAQMSERTVREWCVMCVYVYGWIDGGRDAWMCGGRDGWREGGMEGWMEGSGGGLNGAPA